MAPEQWRTLREWLYRCFPEVEAAELYAAHVREAREAGLPTDGA